MRLAVANGELVDQIATPHLDTHRSVRVLAVPRLAITEAIDAVHAPRLFEPEPFGFVGGPPWPALFSRATHGYTRMGMSVIDSPSKADDVSSAGALGSEIAILTGPFGNTPSASARYRELKPISIGSPV
jgi:hypothetical protein